MSGFLTETCTISTRTQSKTASGQVFTSLGTQTTIACKVQPDSSAQAVELRMQQGIVSARLYTANGASVNHDDQVSYAGDTWRVVGPTYAVIGAQTQWNPIERKVP